MDPVSDLKGKEIKRSTLNELVDYITSGRGVLSEPVYPEIVNTVSINMKAQISHYYVDSKLIHPCSSQQTCLCTFRQILLLDKLILEDSLEDKFTVQLLILALKEKNKCKSDI